MDQNNDDVMADVSDEVLDVDGSENDELEVKEYGKTGSTKILFGKYFKVISENANGSLRGKCLSCSSNAKPLATTEEATSNLTRHLVSENLPDVGFISTTTERLKIINSVYFRKLVMKKS